jgi:hypothetical protein
MKKSRVEFENDSKQALLEVNLEQERIKQLIELDQFDGGA